MNDICSFSFIKILLFNGIIDKNEIDDILILNNLYDYIYELNSEFVMDNRFLDFTDLDIDYIVSNALQNRRYKEVLLRIRFIIL